MKKSLAFTICFLVLVSCQNNAIKSSTVIGYEFNEEGEKLNVIAGDVSITDIYLEFIKAHNDRNLDKIFQMDMDEVVIKAANGSVFKGREAHREALEGWFNASSPTWKVNWMIANTVQDGDGKNQSWLTTGVDVVETVDGNRITTHTVVDVNFIDGKVNELNAYDRPSGKE